MNLRRRFIHTCLYVPYLFHKITGTGPFGCDGAVIVREPMETGGNVLKSALLKYHVKQYHEASCSVASVASVVNVLREIQTGRIEPVDQQDILEKVRTAFWKERMSKKGHNGRRGLPLPLFGEIVKSSLAAYKLSYKTLEIVQVLKKTNRQATLREILWNRLIDFEKNGNSLIIAHFDQGAFVPVLNIPHISPVGGFDVSTGEVTVLDVDPEQERPYKISFETFCKGLFSGYNPVLRPFGYRSGGYVWIKLC